MCMVRYCVIPRHLCLHERSILADLLRQYCTANTRTGADTLPRNFQVHCRHPGSSEQTSATFIAELAVTAATQPSCRQPPAQLHTALTEATVIPAAQACQSDKPAVTHTHANRFYCLHFSLRLQTRATVFALSAAPPTEPSLCFFLRWIDSLFCPEHYCARQQTNSPHPIPS